jgi:hypothetical protein
MVGRVGLSRHDKDFSDADVWDIYFCDRLAGRAKANLSVIEAACWGGERALKPARRLIVRNALPLPWHFPEFGCANETRLHRVAWDRGVSAKLNFPVPASAPLKHLEIARRFDYER